MDDFATLAHKAMHSLKRIHMNKKKDKTKQNSTHTPRYIIRFLNRDSASIFVLQNKLSLNQVTEAVLFVCIFG